MKPFEDLVKTDSPAIEVLKSWINNAVTDCELLEASQENRRILYKIQASTSTILGALAYETGGLKVDNGWLRILGSGNKALPRTLVDLNYKEYGYILFADDAAGGFYAINQGGLGKDINNIYFLAPDFNEWEPLEIDLEIFIQIIMSDEINDFYDGLRWSTWRKDIQSLKPNECFRVLSISMDRPR